MNLSISKYSDQFKLALQLMGGYLLSYYLGGLIIRDNPFLLLLSLSVPLGLLLFTTPRIGFYIIMFSVFFADWLKGLGLIPEQITWLSDVVLLVLFAKVVISKMMDKELIKTSIDIPVLLLILVGIISTLINFEPIMTMILGFRQDLRFVFMFYLLINLNPDEIFLKQIVRILIGLLMIQVPVAMVKYTIYGQGESAIGTYAVHGGTFSTILPLVAISIFSGFFFFEKPRFRYIFFSLLFITFAIIGGKRAFVFFGFLLFLFIFWQVGRKNLGKFSLAAPFLMLGFLACVYFIPSLNPTFENPHHIVDFTVSYTTGYNSRGATIGRTSAIQQAFKVLKNDPKTFLLGFSPGSISQLAFKPPTKKNLRTLGIAYGGTQWVYMSLEYGFLGTILFLCSFLILYKPNRRFFNATTDIFWKAISFGFKGILFTYLIGFFYGRVFRSDVLAFIFWFFAAIICSLEKKRNEL